MSEPADLPVVDCDVHERVASIADLKPYLEEKWYPWVAFDPDVMRSKDMYLTSFSRAAEGTMHADGTDAGCYPQEISRRHLDANGIDVAILCSGNQGVSLLPQGYYAAALATAYNDWLIDTFLPADRRFRGSITVAAQEVDLAVEEIDRLGADPRFVQVMLPINSPSVPWGHRSFHPIWDACVRNDLPVAFHGASANGLAGRPTFAGWPHSYGEQRSQSATAYQTQLISMVVNGVFSQFPGLRVVLVGAGFSWVQSMLWRLDQTWRGVRFETPWLTKPPSDYICEQVRFSSQPMPKGDGARHVEKLIEMIGSESAIMYGSHFPSFDCESPAVVTGYSLPASLTRKILWENAQDTYRLEQPEFSKSAFRKEPGT